MSARGRYFLDTNVLVYCFDAREPAKQKKARQLVEQALTDRQGLISYQVVQELLNVATRRFVVPLSGSDARILLDRVLGPLCEVHASLELYRRALEVAERWRFAFYDALVVAGALAAGCRTLYSEDLQDGQKVEGMTIVNPFVT